MPTTFCTSCRCAVYFIITWLIGTYSECPGNRQNLDRRRLEEAHLTFCVLDVFKRYPNGFLQKIIYSNMEHTLDNVAPIFYDAFSQEYAGT